MSSLLIVESENDKYFFEALIDSINKDIEVDKPICAIDDYECLGGITHLENKLRSIKAKIEKGIYDKIGIIFDADKVGAKERVEEINEKIELVVNEYKDKFRVFIINVDGKGELEDLLIKIKCKDSSIADCLHSWQDCLDKDKKLKPKDFNKFWIQVYQRYDCCSKREAKRASKNCDNKASFQKGIYDLEHEILNELKEFLKELGE